MEETGFDREVLDAVQAETPDLETLLRQRRDYQSAFDKKVSSALQTARANWEREQAEALEQARTQELERARSAVQAEYDARFAALEERSAAQAQRERQVDTADELTRLGLPAGFAPWLTAPRQRSPTPGWRSLSAPSGTRCATALPPAWRARPRRSLSRPRPLTGRVCGA